MIKQKEIQLHYLMCLSGGFAGTYSLLRCGEHFGAAQTTNLICTLEALLGHEPKDFLLRLLGLVFYMAGIASFVFVSRRTNWDIQKWALATQCLCLLLFGLIPARSSMFLCLYPAFYMLAVQWSVFHGAGSYTASTIFSTNNIRQFTLAGLEYLMDRKKEQARKAKFFGLTLVFYHLGAVLTIISYRELGHFSAWCGFPVLLAAGRLVCSPRHRVSHITLKQHRRLTARICDK